MSDCFTCAWADQCRRQDTDAAAWCPERVAVSADPVSGAPAQRVALTMVDTARTVVVGVIAVALAAAGVD